MVKDNLKVISSEEEDIIYYYTDEMKNDGFFFRAIRYVSDHNESSLMMMMMKVKIELVYVDKDMAVLYEIYDDVARENIEVYMMINFMAERYEKGSAFHDFAFEMSSSSISSAGQSSEENKQSVHDWLSETYQEFLDQFETSS